MMRSWVFVIAILGLAAASALAQETAIERGEAEFRKCLACHKVGEGAFNTIGPVLNDVLGRQAGTFPNFIYSQVMVDAGEAGLVWTADTMSMFLAAPRKFLPGNKMTFAGMRNAQDRSNLIAYLRTLSPGYVPPTK
jgi:cytochrome c2